MSEKPVVEINTLFIEVDGREVKLPGFAVLPVELDPDSIELIEHRKMGGATRHVVATVADGMPHAGAVVSVTVAYLRPSTDHQWFYCSEHERWHLWHTEEAAGPLVGQFTVIG